MISNLQLKSVYSTNTDDIASSFYVPVLSEANSYKRVSGYFSSAALALFAKGIEELAYNNGKYQLLISNQISANDFSLIKTGYQNRASYKNIISDRLNDYSSLSSNQKKNFANLAYLIEIGLMDVKVGFTEEGLFHSKYGIISDENNNKVYFSGSLNETKAAFIKNYESITVLKSWTNQSDYQTIQNQENQFDQLWNNNSEDFIFVKEFNEIVRSTLMNYSKGKIIMDSSLFTENALVIYFENNKLKIKNNLSSKKIDEKERSIKHIKNKYLIKEEFWNFADDLSLKDVQDILKQMKKYEKRTNTKIMVSETVKNYIESKNFNIEDISNRGTLIKNKDKTIVEQFNQFNQIVSSEVTRNLRPVQSWVSFYMAMMKRVGNFSVPGSGKTAMLYGTYAYLSSENIDEVDQIIMIGPKSSFLSWKNEFIEVFQYKRDLRVLDIHADDFHPRMLNRNTDHYNLILINYESLQKYEDELKDILDDKTMLIFDEVHKIKKIDGIRAQVALSISELVKYRYVLTGTPLPNGYIDVWNFLHILYKNEYNDFFGFSKYKLNNMDAVSAETFNEKLFPFYWRVTKKDLEVPEVNPDNLYSSKATNIEQEVINMLWRKYRSNPFVLYTRLIQFSSNPSLLRKSIDRSLFIDYHNDDLDDELMFEFNEDMEDTPQYTSEELSLIDRLSVSSKFESALSKADSLIQENKTIIIWCIFKDTMQKVANRLEKMGHRVALINGDTLTAERETMITNYQNGLYDVLVTNPHTLAESVSLHKVSHDAIYLEFSFNLTHMLQSRDRIHRLGLKGSDETNYYYYFLEGQEGERNTIDRKIYNRLKEKEEIMIESIEGTSIGVEFNTDEKDEIRKLMEEEING